MGLSVNEFTYAGNDTFNINFAMGYASRQDITCTNVTQDVQLFFDWVNDGLVTLLPGHGSINGDIIEFRRTVSKTSLPVNLMLEQNATREGLEQSFQGVFYAIHELLDERAATPYPWEVLGNADQIEDMLLTDFLSIYNDGKNDADI